MHKLAEGLWSIPYLANTVGRAVIFPAKTWVVALTEGGVGLISPGPTAIEQREALARIGEVKWLVAPNCFHHLYVQAAQQAFPQAKTFIAPGLERKRKDIAYDALISAEEIDPALKHLQLAGAPKFGETVFFHHSSKTLLLTDLVFNMQKVEHGWLTPTMLRLSGTYRRLALSRVVTVLIRDKAAVASCLQEVLSWDFDQVDPNHGETLTTHAKDALRRAWASFPGIQPPDIK